MKLSEYAKRKGISYKTAWRWFKQGIIKGYQVPTGTIIVEEESSKRGNRVIIYARVSDRARRDELEGQARRLMEYAVARGYQIVAVVKEIGSGVSDKRKKLIEVFSRDDYDILLVEHKGKLTSFGFTYIQKLLERLGKHVEEVNASQDDREELIRDFFYLVRSLTVKLYGIKRAKEKTEKIKHVLLTEDSGGKNE